jgi:hypothetical protein
MNRFGVWRNERHGRQNAGQPRHQAADEHWQRAGDNDHSTLVQILILKEPFNSRILFSIFQINSYTIFLFYAKLGSG